MSHACYIQPTSAATCTCAVGDQRSALGFTNLLSRPAAQHREGTSANVEPTGEYIGLVVRLASAADGSWIIVVDGTHSSLTLPLVPATLIVRLWRNDETGLLRGSIGLEGSGQWVPLHSNTTLIELLHTWLLNNGHTTKAT